MSQRGMATRRMVKLGLMRKVVLGKNSPVSRIIRVEMMVLRISMRACCWPSQCPSSGSRMAEKAMPYITSATLLPTRSVEINISARREKPWSMRETMPRRVASILMRTLSDCTNAISAPEKRPEKRMAIKVMTIAIVRSIVSLLFAVCWRKRTGLMRLPERMSEASVLERRRLPG